MPGVPAKILVGPTTYVHLRRKHRDYYAPDFLLSPELLASPDASPHVWRYTISPDHHNTVFFYNATSKTSVWVLPVVHPDGRTEELPEGEVMRAIREASPGAVGAHTEAGGRDVATAPAAQGKAEAGQPETGSGRAAVEGETVDDQNSAARNDLAGNPVATPANALPATKASESAVPPAGTAAEAPSDAPPSSSGGAGVSRERVQAAVLRAQQANPLTISIGAGESVTESSPADHSAPTTSLQRRLAAWRAKRLQSPSATVDDGSTFASSPLAVQRQSSSVTQQDGSPPPPQDANTPSPITVNTDPLLAVARSTSAPSAASVVTASIGPSPSFASAVATPQLVASASEATHPVMPASVFATVPTAPQGKSAPLTPPRKGQEASSPEQSREPTAPVRGSPDSSPALNLAAQQRKAQEAELARVAALLHREKLAAMEQERAALECRRRAVAVEQQEAEERARMMAVRVAAERNRVEAEERLAEERRRQQRRLEASAAADARVGEVNQHVVKHRQMEEEAEATVAESFSYAARIAAQLAAAAPRPEEITSALLKERDALPIPSESAGARRSPTLCEQPARRGRQNAPAEAPALRALSHNIQAAAAHTGSASNKLMSGTPAPPVPVPVPMRTHEHICYGVPFVYDGEVVDYKPARAFVSSPQALLSVKSKSRAGALGNNEMLASASAPEVPVLLTLKREGQGTQYYDASRQHFFTGEWHDDKRAGAGVLSLPNSAVQGRWLNDQLTGSAVVQTRHAKANLVVAGASSNTPSTALSREKSEGVAAVTSQRAKESPSPHVALNGNAVVELDTNALFVGFLRDGRVGAPYVLQLGEGDYVEWLGPPTTTPPPTRNSATPGRAATGGRQRQLAVSPPARKSGAPSLSAPRGRTVAGSGECRVRFRNGDTYVGHVRGFRLHGTGYYRFAADGQSYTGAFQRGLPHGAGLMIFANGDLYKGQFRNGLFDGVGAYSCKAGRYVYEGGWVDGSMTGAGTLSYANGDVWEGMFKDNVRVSGAYTAVA
ncbi:hypothetical protein ABB37_08639 [Leptomonas pyrrhocoris]|uniref:WW domain-containing protein n=1 Tax=Leptomonas pyrrhocoris TaxID=157538 RepID=A0A0M9FSS8_LEPPY|nr:hypothetical protein ABB37_08639 [Leptomonas pyrrhocoris]KPA75350.1 hypothetical protein ABB37_08639 [Leptomonas pyrrhocoris]|eukprot:XP_015653789.1 hypothetical protein ABB37_08639 [Leptomonas pyrrhocoris]